MMKYVVSDQDEVAIGRGMFHKDLAHGFKGRVIAAGYCAIDAASVAVSGKSEGFGIAAQPEDAVRLEKFLRESH